MIKSHINVIQKCNGVPFLTLESLKRIINAIITTIHPSINQSPIGSDKVGSIRLKGGPLNLIE